MKIKLPVTWQVCGTIEVEAESIEDAIKNFDAHNEELPDDFEYVEDSFELSFDDVGAIKMFQKIKI